MTKTGEAARPVLDLPQESVMEKLERHQKPILVGALVVAALAGGTWMWSASGKKKEANATAAYAAAESAFGAGNAQLAQPELEKVLQRYAGTTAGTQAAMLLAQILFDQGKHAEGIAKLEPALAKSPDHLKAPVLNLLASGHEGAGQPAEAAKRFEEAAAISTFAADADHFRMSAARNHAAAGNVAGAKSIYEEISAREDSDFAGEASVRLGELKVKA